MRGDISSMGPGWDWGMLNVVQAENDKDEFEKRKRDLAI